MQDKPRLRWKFTVEGVLNIVYLQSSAFTTFVSISSGEKVEVFLAERTFRPSSGVTS